LKNVIDQQGDFVDKYLQFQDKGSKMGKMALSLPKTGFGGSFQCVGRFDLRDSLEFF